MLKQQELYLVLAKQNSQSHVEVSEELINPPMSESGSPSRIQEVRNEPDLLRMFIFVFVSVYLLSITVEGSRSPRAVKKK
jgi:hypothetical protein